MKRKYNYTKEELHIAQLDIFSIVPFDMGINPKIRIDWFEENIYDLFDELKITEEEKQKFKPKTKEIITYLFEKYKRLGV